MSHLEYEDLWKLLYLFEINSFHSSVRLIGRGGGGVRHREVSEHSSQWVGQWHLLALIKKIDLNIYGKSLRYFQVRPLKSKHSPTQSEPALVQRFICSPGSNLSNYVKEERAGGDDHNLILINHISTSRLVAGCNLFKSPVGIKQV